MLSKIEQLDSNDNNMDQPTKLGDFNKHQNTEARGKTSHGETPITGTFVEGCTEKHQLTWRTREKTNPQSQRVPESVSGQRTGRSGHVTCWCRYNGYCNGGRTGKPSTQSAFSNCSENNGCPVSRLFQDSISTQSKRVVKKHSASPLCSEPARVTQKKGDRDVKRRLHWLSCV